MSRARNQDFLDRYAWLERRVRDLERQPSAYMESVIVGGEFDHTTEIPPFFTPFGGALVAAKARFITGDEVEIRILKNTVNIFGGLATWDLTAPLTTFDQEFDPPIYLDEGDIIQVDVIGIAGTTSGLSVGHIIHP